MRVRIGLREYQLETDTRASIGGGAALPAREALRVLAGVRDPATLATIRALAIGAGARSFEWDEELGLRIATLLGTGRLRLREIEAQSLRVLSREAEPEPEP